MDTTNWHHFPHLDNGLWLHLPLGAPAKEGVEAHVAIKGGGADDGRVAWTPMTLKNPLSGCWEFVHHLEKHKQPNTLNQQTTTFSKQYQRDKE